LIYRRRSYRSIDSIHPRLEDHAGAALQIKTKTDLGRSLKEYGCGASYQDDQKGKESATWP
jgi:hypothetical protein